MQDTDLGTRSVWSINILGWVLLAATALVLAAIFNDGLSIMVSWWSREEYSHGYLLPVISAFLIWQQRSVLEKTAFSGSWAGLVILGLGIVLMVAGKLSTLYVVTQYAFLVVLGGLLLSFMGWRGFRIILVPYLLLVFMIPLPNFLYNNLSSQLQLVSSQLGVEVIRMFGISVHLEGNVIDLGNYKLQVVEACNGLRYLFPLMSFGFICAYLFKAPFWQRAVIFLSTIPITVLMNSFRIGVIGVLVDNWGIAQAEGFLHDFEGWVIFMACTAILFALMWILLRFQKERRPLREAFGLEFPEPSPEGAQVRIRPMPRSFVASVAVLAAAALGAFGLDERSEVIPERMVLSQVPTRMGEWQGQEDRLEDIYLSALKLTDYYIGDFTNPAGEAVNFYVAYYESQRAGGSAHSPRSCIPGGGWVIKDLTQRQVEGVSVGGRPLMVNRLQIQKGDYKQLVYYWFQQRGRVITNEYLVKWFLFWDALTRNRTDGALVRLTTRMKPHESWEAGDARLTEFARAAAGDLDKYIPE